MELPSSSQKTSYYLVGDEGFPLKEYLLGQFPRRLLRTREKVFNYRLSRARRIVECAFGVLSSKFRLLRTEIAVYVNRAEKLVKACCIIHNILIDKEGSLEVGHFTDASQDSRVSEARNAPVRE